MPKRPKRYGALAEMLDVAHCRGILPSGSYCSAYVSHNLGEVTEDNVVHWADRRMEWSGLVRFLKLVAMARDPSIVKLRGWQRIYRLNMALKEVQRDAHTRIPARYLRADRTYVRASVAALPSSTPMRQEAFDWSRREAGKTWG